jgi:hypothetical protein
MYPGTYCGAPMDKKFNPKLTENNIRGPNFCCKTDLNRNLEALIKTTSRILSKPVPELGNFQLQSRHANIFNVCLLLSCYTYKQCYELNYGFHFLRESGFHLEIAKALKKIYLITAPKFESICQYINLKTQIIYIYIYI